MSSSSVVVVALVSMAALTDQLTLACLCVELALYDDCSVSENFRFYGTMACMTLEDIAVRQEWLLGFLELGHMSNRIVSSLSGGQKRRVSLAVSLLHSPELLILDEPTVGMLSLSSSSSSLSFGTHRCVRACVYACSRVGVDPLLRNRIWKYLRKLNQLGTTIIITTHYIEEAAQADCVGLMRGGKLLEEGAPADLIAKYSVPTLEDVFLYLCKLSEVNAAAVAAQQAAGSGDAGANDAPLLTSRDSDSSEYASLSMPRLSPDDHIDIDDDERERDHDHGRDYDENDLEAAVVFATPMASASSSVSASTSSSSYATTTTAPHTAVNLLMADSSPARAVSPVPRSPSRSPSPALLRSPSPAHRSVSPGPRSVSPGPRSVSPGPRSVSPGPRMRKTGPSVSDEYEFTEHVQATPVHESAWIRKSAQHIGAICRRKCTQMMRNPRAFIFEFFLPVAQMFLFLVAIGNDPTGLPVVVVNHDVGFEIGFGHLRHSVNLGQQYTDHLRALDDHVLQVTEMEHLDAAVQLVRAGDAWTVVYIPESFTSNLMMSLAGDHINTTDSQVVLYMDLSNYQVTLVIDKELAYALDGTSSSSHEWRELRAGEPLREFE